MPAPAEIREELQPLVLADLLGPQDGPAEVVDEASVRDRYLVGMLAPPGRRLAEMDEDLAVAYTDGEDGGTDSPPPAAATLLPSSMGLTFAVQGDTPALRLTVHWGRYERVTMRWCRQPWPPSPRG